MLIAWRQHSHGPAGVVGGAAVGAWHLVLLHRTIAATPLWPPAIRHRVRAGHAMHWEGNGHGSRRVRVMVSPPAPAAPPNKSERKTGPVSLDLKLLSWTLSGRAKPTYVTVPLYHYNLIIIRTWFLAHQILGSGTRLKFL